VVVGSVNTNSDAGVGVDGDRVVKNVGIGADVGVDRSSKCRGESDLGLCTTSVLANRMPPRISKFFQILWLNTFFNWKSPPRSGILFASTEVVNRP